MRRITYEQYKTELVDFFKKINNSFILNNIFWWAHSGTLLGSVRNKKIIPWDDDIDMAMTCFDFYQNLDIIKGIGIDLNYKIADKCNFNGLNNSRLISNERIIVVYEDVEYITSLFIDIMIAIPIKKENRIRNYYWFLSCRWSILFSSFWKPLPDYRLKSNTAVKIPWIIHIIVWLSRLLVFPLYISIIFEKRLIIKSAKIKTNNKLALHYGWSHINIIYNMAEFHLSTIEGVSINIPTNWNEELTKRYGKNYMIPPKQEFRRPHHIILTPNNKKKWNIFPYIIK